MSNFKRSLSEEEYLDMKTKLAAGTHLLVILTHDPENGFCWFGGAFDNMFTLVNAWGRDVSLCVAQKGFHKIEFYALCPYQRGRYYDADCEAILVEKNTVTDRGG